MDGGTVFHFVTDGIEAALERAYEAANGQDVRLAAAPPRSGSTCVPGWSTRYIWRMRRCCSAAESGSSTGSITCPPDTRLPDSLVRRRHYTCASSGRPNVRRIAESPPSDIGTRRPTLSTSFQVLAVG